MNQGRKFMGQEQLCIPSSASDLLCQAASVSFGCSPVCGRCDDDYAPTSPIFSTKYYQAIVIFSDMEKVL